MKYVFLLAPFALMLQSCEQQTRKNHNSSSVEHPSQSFSKMNEKKSSSPTSKDNFVFEAYYDDGDYYILNAKIGEQEYTFINDDNDDRSLVKGDRCEIIWKKDSITIPGDGESKALANWIISVKKIK